MAAKIIYLDQNKWIALARSAAGPGDEITPVVEFVRAAKASGLAVFPLSAAHYVESNKHRDDDRYERLGRFMHELSGTVTMASPLAIIRHEVELAFAHALPRRIDVQPFSLLGKGVGHALDMPGVRFTLRGPEGVTSDEQREQIEKDANAALEESILTGRIPGGERMPRGRPDLSRYNQAFVSELYDFRKRLDCGDQELRQRAVYANVMVAMLDQINEALEHHKIPHGVFEAMGMDGITAFLEDMPSARVNIHLRRHWIANPRLDAKENDHNDWFYLGAAAAHCDIVVAENHFTHVVNTGKLRKRAIVITDLRELPRY